jgi:hypothetical protein
MKAQNSAGKMTCHFSPMRAKTPSLQIDNFLYTIEALQASAHPVSSADWFLPRNLVSHAGCSIPVSSLGYLSRSSSKSASVHFACIPSSVETLYEHSFAGWTDLLHLAFESNSRIFALPDRLFVGCDSLRSICIPASVTAISNHCFLGCKALLRVTFGDGCRASFLGFSAFELCSSLQSISIPSSVQSLCSSCFSGCRRLWFIGFEPESRLSILGDWVFEDCDSLRSIWIPAGVLTMTGSTFARSPTKIVEIDEENPLFEVCEDFIVNCDANSLVRYFGAEKVLIIDRAVLRIGSGCFREVYQISAVRFEAGSLVSAVESFAFYACSRLESFVIPATVEKIGDDCFRLCEKLGTVTFERVSRVFMFGDRAFADCSALASICIPSSVTKIGDECFSGCSSLATVNVENGIRISVVGRFAFSDCSSSLRLPAALAGH